METTKVARRRTGEVDTEGPILAKRKIQRKREIEQDDSDSVQIVGETHASMVDDYGQPMNPKRMLMSGCVPHGAIQGNGVRYSNNNINVSGKRAVNGLANRTNPHTTPTPGLPPNPRESERMLCVQQWINSIRLDLPPWVQTSLTQIVPLSNPPTYPTGDVSSLTASKSMSCDGTSLVGLDQLYSNAPGRSLPGSSSATGHHGNHPQFPRQQPYISHSRENGSQLGNGVTFPHKTFIHGRGDCQPAPVGRLFDDFETQMVVKLFRDYFTKGSCPMLEEVRRRTCNTILEGRRTATSIRSKIKRLQASGRWTDYAGI